MMLGEMRDFTFKTTQEFWGDARIDAGYLSDAELEKIMAAGSKLFTQLSQKPPSGLHKWAKRIMVPVVGAGLTAGAGLAISGALSAGTAAASAAASQPITAGTTIASQAAKGAIAKTAASSGLSASSMIGAAKSYVPKIAGVVSAAAKKAGKKGVADVAGVIAGSDDITDAVVGIASNEMAKRYGEPSGEGKAAMRELVKREQRRLAREYERELRRLQEQKARQYTDPKPAFPTWAYAAIPLAFIALGDQ